MSRMVRQRGMTLIEISLTLVILGLITSLLAALVPAIQRLAMVEEAIGDYTEVHDAIAGFALATGRLPCADSDGDGVEDCSAVTGYLPYVTLGMGGPLRNAIGNDYRYGVYSRSDSSIMNDVALTAIQDRWEPTLASGLPPATALTAYGNLSQLDLCRALGVGRQSSVDTSYLNVAATLSNEHVAYVLVDPGSADLDGDGSLLDGLNSSGLTFEHPTTSASSDYDDEVKVVYFDEMWARMGCSGLLSPAGHAHPNVESTLALFRQSFRDYLSQLEITEEMAQADILAQTAAVAMATAGLASASALIPMSTASALETFGATSPGIALSVAAVTANTAALATAVAAEVETIENEETISGQVDDLENIIDDLDELYESVQDNVEASDLNAISQ